MKDNLTILHDIRQGHEYDAESAPNQSNALKMIADVKKAMRFPGNALGSRKRR